MAEINPAKLAAGALIVIAFAAGYYAGFSSGGNCPNSGPAACPAANTAADKPAPSVLTTEETSVTRVIDGDTVVVLGGGSVRLIGIDADEKGHPCYDEAKSRLEELVLDKTVVLEPESSDADQYGRKLRYLFVGGDNINLRMIAEGLAVARIYPENKKYSAEIIRAESDAKDANTGCEWLVTPAQK